MNLTHRLQLHVLLFWIVVLGSILLTALVVQPFISAIISAYILSYMLRPLFLKFKSRYSNKISALLCIAIAVVLVIIPTVIISLEILKLLGNAATGHGEIMNLIDTLTAHPFLKSLSIDSVELKASIIQAMSDIVNSTIQGVPNFIIGLIVTLNGIFYILCNWNELVSHLKKYLPFKNNNKIIAKLGSKTNSLINGQVLVSLIEAIIAFVGFSLIGVPASLIFAVLIFIFAFLPSIGTELVWIPLALYYFSINQYVTMTCIIIIGLILWIGIEFYFYTRFIGSKAHIHPFIILVGVLGGIYIFGIFGFIIGPLLLANSIEIIEMAISSHETKTKKR